MSPLSRRIFLYWLLLLVPALIVGLAAVALLQREQKRLALQGSAALEARRAAVGARARLIVENTELLVGDVQNGLLDTLDGVPDAQLGEFLDTWEKTNPLVKVTFIATTNGELLRPAANTSGDQARGFLRRFAPLWRARPPWQSTENSLAAAAKKQANTLSAAKAEESRKVIEANVAQMQSARRDVQQLLNSNSYASLSKTKPPEAAANTEADRATDEYFPRSRSVGNAPSVAGGIVLTNPTEKRSAAPAIAPSPPSRRGWFPTSIDGHLHLIAWVEPAASDRVRGVEIDLAALVDRLSGALPVQFSPDEAFVLRDDHGRVLHQVGYVSANVAPIASIAISTDLLPGWQVSGYLAQTTSRAGDGHTLLWIGTLLILIFITAIVAGGSLLLAQARRSGAEAAQKTSFVANVSHEFKTPLTTIRLYAELLEQNRVRDAVQSSAYLRTIQQETQRLTRLVNNVLDFSRLEQGRKKYARASVDVAAGLNRLLDTHAPRIAEAGLQLQREIPASPVVLETDLDALDQIVINLLDNACKYAADGGQVSVSLVRRGSGAEIHVADRGPGIPPEQREKIFEKFHRMDTALTAERTGTGLGLSIARQLARGLGGDLRCVSGEPNGAEFILELRGPDANT